MRNNIFCYSKLTQHRERSIKNFSKYDYLFKHSGDNIFDKINSHISNRKLEYQQKFNEAKENSNLDQDLKINFQHIIEIASRSCYLSNKVRSLCPESNITICDHSDLILKPFESLYKTYLMENQLVLLEPNNYDIVLSSLYLHWANDVPVFIENARQLLRKNGIAILSFIGGNSLKNLRRFFIKAELELKIPNTPHISPFITQESILKTLQNMNIDNIIVDSDILEVEYKTCYQLIKELNLMGESNCLTSSINYGLCKNILEQTKTKEKFTEIFEIIYLTFIKK